MSVAPEYYEEGREHGGEEGEGGEVRAETECADALGEKDLVGLALVEGEGGDLYCDAVNMNGFGD